MKHYWTTSGIPELESFSEPARTEIHRRYYRRSVMSLRGLLAFVVYTLIVACALMLNEFMAAPKFLVILVANVIAVFVSGAIIAMDVRRRLSRDLACGEMKDNPLTK